NRFFCIRTIRVICGETFCGSTQGGWATNEFMTMNSTKGTPTEHRRALVPGSLLIAGGYFQKLP
ncbi:MAG: hypothetical protein ABI273_02590, partial [Lacunisphaera sp.]